MSNFTRVESVEASYSEICLGVGSTDLAASPSVDVSGNAKETRASTENAHHKVRVLVALFSLWARILWLRAVEHATLLHKAAPVIVNRRLAANRFGADSQEIVNPCYFVA